MLDLDSSSEERKTSPKEEKLVQVKDGVAPCLLDVEIENYMLTHASLQL